ncbi:hypothetical protein JCM10213_006659 [Rhodosporidiobolus nylandii]
MAHRLPVMFPCARDGPGPQVLNNANAAAAQLNARIGAVFDRFRQVWDGVREVAYAGYTLVAPLSALPPPWGISRATWDERQAHVHREFARLMTEIFGLYEKISRAETLEGASPHIDQCKELVSEVSRLEVTKTLAETLHRHSNMIGRDDDGVKDLIQMKADEVQNYMREQMAQHRARAPHGYDVEQDLRGQLVKQMEDLAMQARSPLYSLRALAHQYGCARNSSPATPLNPPAASSSTRTPSPPPTVPGQPPVTTASPKKRRPVEPAFERREKKRRVEAPARGGTGARAGGRAGEGDEDRTSRLGEQYSPGDGQADYTLTAPLPTRDPVSREFTFEDWPDFKPNMSPEEIIRQGSFDGGYFRPVKSRKSGRELHEDWKDFPKEWYEGLDTSMYLTRPELVSPADAATSVNRWKEKMGQGYEDWEKNGWIVAEHDARGWYQWYYRFFLGRRCDDDERQVGRWARCAGEQSGRWRRILLEKYRKAGVNVVEPEQESVSKGIRQTLNHWAYDPTTDHLNRFRREKGDWVGNDEEEAGEG